MSPAPTPQAAVSRVVLVPAATNSSRGDELVRRYRLARVRLAGREAAVAAHRSTPVRSD